MEPAWHPLSALHLAEPRSFVTSAVLRRLLARGGRATLIYSGDRMWPTLKHGQSFVAHPLPAGGAPPGSTVVISPEGIPDVARVVGTGPEGVQVVCDADPSPPMIVPHAQMLALAALPAGSAGRTHRAIRRLAIDLREALQAGPDAAQDAASTVQAKYEALAPFYARTATVQLEPPVMEALRRAAPPGSRVIVAGSGAGWECFALEQQGCAVKGIDFAPSMVELAQRESRNRASTVVFQQADLRSHSEPDGSVSAVMFTFDVYSFLPERAARVALLRRMHRWLRPEGALLLSARRLHSAYRRILFTAQWLAALARGGPPSGTARAWGDSHTRWITTEGAICRSFVHHFSDDAIRRETREGGFQAGAWIGGHCVLTKLS